MIKINWFLFFRHRVIFGFYVKRKTMVTNTGVFIPGGPWRPHWRWNWGDKFEWKIKSRRKQVPWHRCWYWGEVHK